MQQNWIDFCETANTLCLLFKISNDQMYQKLSHQFRGHTVYDFFTGQILQHNLLDLCEADNILCLLCSLSDRQMHNKLSQ